MNAVILSDDYPHLEIPEEFRNRPLVSSKETFELVKKFSCQKPEYAIMITVGSNDKIIAARLVSIGGRHHAIMSICDMLRAALLDGADGVIFVHNHPDSDLQPSSDDESHVQKMKEAGATLGIEILDSLIISGDNYQSMFRDSETKEKVELAKDYLMKAFSAIRFLGNMLEAVGIVILSLFVVATYSLLANNQPLPPLTPELTTIIMIYPLAWVARTIGKFGEDLCGE